MTAKKKKIIEFYDKNKKRVVKAVIAEENPFAKDAYIYDYIMAQIEVYAVMDEMELGIATIIKN